MKLIHAVFEKLTLKFCARVLYAPGEPLPFFFFFLSPEMWGPLRPKYPKTIEKHKYLAKKTKKTSFVNGSAGACTTR